MRAPTKIQCGLLATASGIAVESLSTMPFYATPFHSAWFGTYYQALVGLFMLFVGFCAGTVCFEDISFSSKAVYLSSGILLFVPGIFVLTNIYRYDLVFSHVGSWPIHAIGIVMAFDGALTLGYGLTVYQPPPPA